MFWYSATGNLSEIQDMVKVQSKVYISCKIGIDGHRALQENSGFGVCTSRDSSLQLALLLPSFSTLASSVSRSSCPNTHLIVAQQTSQGPQLVQCVRNVLDQVTLSLRNVDRLTFSLNRSGNARTFHIRVQVDKTICFPAFSHSAAGKS